MVRKLLDNKQRQEHLDLIASHVESSQATATWYSRDGVTYTGSTGVDTINEAPGRTFRVIYQWLDLTQDASVEGGATDMPRYAEVLVPFDSMESPPALLDRFTLDTETEVEAFTVTQIGIDSVKAGWVCRAVVQS